MNKGSIWHHAPIVVNLISYLSIIDFINLRRAVKALPSSIGSPAELLFQRLVLHLKRFTQLGADLRDELIRLLSERDDFYLSGGFLIALLRSDTFDVSVQDLDFFITNDSFQASPKIQRLVEYRDDVPFCVVPDTDLQYAHVMPFLRIYDIANSPVQLIVHASKETLHQSIYTFDLPVCRNYFSRTAGLRIFRIEDLMYQRTTVETSQLLSRIFGLQIRTELVPIYATNQRRIEKYRKRGFNVKVNVATPKELEPLIPPKNEMPLYDMLYYLTGRHGPSVCSTGQACLCTHSNYNPRCYHAYHRCLCEAHVAFNTQIKAQYEIWRRRHMIDDHIAFWSRFI